MRNKMTETTLNTLALNTNTAWIIISVIVTIGLSIIGYLINRYRGRDIIKNTSNKRGKISQTNGDSLVDNVDNEEGSIIQK